MPVPRDAGRDHDHARHATVRHPREADAAIAALKAEGFPKKLYTLIAPGTGGDAAAAIKAAGVFAKPAATYAAEVAAGRALVIVQAPTGGYFVVRDLLDEAGPLPSPVARPDVHLRSVESRGADFLPPGVKRKHWADFFPLLWDRGTLPRGLYLSDSGWGTLFPNRDRPRSTYLTDMAWGTIVPNKDGRAPPTSRTTPGAA